MAMDVDQCPRESRTLHPNYTSKKKIKAFSHDGACPCVIDTTSCGSTSTQNDEKDLQATISLCAARDSRRIARNIDKIWAFDARELRAMSVVSTSERDCARENRRCCTARNAPLSL
jgi:hypothetical protein